MRIDYKRRPEVYRPMRALKEAEGVGTLEPALMELVRIRASQLNGCTRCIEIHTKDARAMGEDDMRLDLVVAWRELRTLRDPDLFEPWLHRILTNQCYAEARRRTRWSADIRTS